MRVLVWEIKKSVRPSCKVHDFVQQNLTLHLHQFAFTNNKPILFRQKLTLHPKIPNIREPHKRDPLYSKFLLPAVKGRGDDKGFIEK